MMVRVCRARSAPIVPARPGTATPQRRNFAYWRDKQGHQVDFVFSSVRSEPLAIACKRRADSLSASAIGLDAGRRLTYSDHRGWQIPHPDTRR